MSLRIRHPTNRTTHLPGSSLIIAGVRTSSNPDKPLHGHEEVDKALEERSQVSMPRIVNLAWITEKVRYAQIPRPRHVYPPGSQEVQIGGSTS